MFNYLPTTSALSLDALLLQQKSHTVNGRQLYLPTGLVLCERDMQRSCVCLSVGRLVFSDGPALLALV